MANTGKRAVEEVLRTPPRTKKIDLKLTPGRDPESNDHLDQPVANSKKPVSSPEVESEDDTPLAILGEKYRMEKKGKTDVSKKKNPSSFGKILFDLGPMPHRVNRQSVDDGAVDEERQGDQVTHLRKCNEGYGAFSQSLGRLD